MPSRPRKITRRCIVCGYKCIRGRVPNAAWGRDIAPAGQWPTSLRYLRRYRPYRLASRVGDWVHPRCVYRALAGRPLGVALGGELHNRFAARAFDQDLRRLTAEEIRTEGVCRLPERPAAVSPPPA